MLRLLRAGRLASTSDANHDPHGATSARKGEQHMQEARERCLAALRRNQRAVRLSLDTNMSGDHAPLAARQGAKLDS